MAERKISLTSTDVPSDIVFSILSKLPLKSFKRFEYVCKSWSLLCRDPYFMNLYRKSFLAKDLSYCDDTSLLLHLLDEDYGPHLYSFSGEKFENRVKLELSKPFQQHFFELLGPASINGILCLRIHNVGMEIILWNPTTNQFKKVPSSQSDSIPLGWNNGFNHYLNGYDRNKHDYKIVQITLGPRRCAGIRHVSSLKIYSLRRNSWKNMNVDNMPQFHVNIHKVYMDGMSHWWNNINTDTYLISFDFTTETFITTPMPSYVDDRLVSVYSCMKKLMILNGSIALTLHHEETCIFHILILGEIGGKESWTKLFVVGPSPFLKYSIGAGRKGKLLFMRKDNELVWFDLSTGMIDEIGVKALSNTCDLLFHMQNFF